MNQQELYREARRRVERRRQQAEAEAERHRAALFAAQPRLGALQAEMAEAGAGAARLAAEGFGQEAAQQLERFDRLAKEYQKLLAGGKATPQYHCATCNDTGRDGGATCACVLEEVKRLRRRQINETGPLMLCRFENFSLDYYPQRMENLGFSPRATMEAIVQECRDWAADFGPHSQSLYMYGDAGLGKTHLALSIASEVLDAGHDVIYVSAHSAFATVAEQRYDGGGEFFNSMLQADLLVLDDLGTEFLDAYTRGKLYELVNTRLYRRPTIYTSNIWRTEQLEQRYDEKISSRLLGECHLMRFWGHDIRLQKRR